MLKMRTDVLLFSAVVSMCSATGVNAGPVIYASSDPSTSTGTELYVIDPIAATITVVRGMGIGSGGTATFAGSNAGGNGTNGSGIADAGASALSGFGGLGGFANFAAAGRATPHLLATTDDPAGPTDLSVSSEPINIVPQRGAIAFADPVPSEIFGGGKLAGTPPDPLPSGSAGSGGSAGPGFNAGPGSNAGPSANAGPNCTGECGSSPTTTLVNCTGDCRGDPVVLSSVQIAAVPEPGLLALLGVAFASLGAVRRRISI
jgi:hypothetical protein